MKLGYDRPLDLVAFDHRSSFSKGLFGATEPLSPEIVAKVSDTKELIFEAFQQAIARGAPRRRSGVLVDEAVRRCRRTEGQGEWVSRWRCRWRSRARPSSNSNTATTSERHIEAFDPDFSKVLVRYNPEGDSELNRRQTNKLAALSELAACPSTEFLVRAPRPATPAQLERCGEPGALRSRAPARSGRAGFARAAARRRGAGHLEDRGARDRAPIARGWWSKPEAGPDATSVVCIVLGRGASFERVLTWLAIAAPGAGLCRLRRRANALAGSLEALRRRQAIACRRESADRRSLPANDRCLRAYAGARQTSSVPQGR